MFKDMKRLILTLACAIAALASCTKPNDTPKAMDAPANKEFHANISLDAADFAEPLMTADAPKTITVTSGGKFMLGFYDKEAETPASSPLIYKSGEYTVTKAPSAGMVFNFAMFGSLCIKELEGNNWKVEYTGPKGGKYSGKAIAIADKFTSAFATDLCRSWKPKSMVVTVSGGDLANPVGKTFGADIKEILDFMVSKGVKVDAEKYAKYQLQSIDYTEDGQLLVNFKDFAIAPFAGHFDLDETKDENIAYNFDLNWEDTKVIPISGKGGVKVTNSVMTLNTESDITVKGKNYHVILTIIADEIK